MYAKAVHIPFYFFIFFRFIFCISFFYFFLQFIFSYTFFNIFLFFSPPSFSLFLVGFCVVAAWMLIFSTHFKEQFIAHNSSNDSYTPGAADRVVLNQKLDIKNDRNDRNEKGSDDNGNTFILQALSFDEEHSAEEDSLSKTTSRKQANSENNLMNLNLPNNSNNSNNSDKNITSFPGVGKRKYKVQVSEESAIVKMEHIELITSWLPGMPAIP